MKIKNPIINSILYAAFFLIIFFILNPLLSFLLGFLGITDQVVIACVMSIVLFIIYVLVYRKKFEKLISSDNLKLGILLGLPAILLIFLPDLFEIQSNNFFNLNLSLSAICYAIIGGLGPGISEEIIFRGALVNSFMEKNNQEKLIPLIVFLSAIFFSLVHACNLVIGADLNQTILQLIYAFGLGAFFAAIYLRTGNLLTVIFWHFLIDFIAYLSPEVAQTGGILTTSINLLAPSHIAMIILSIILVIIAFYYVRPKKYSEIMELWNLKKI